MKKDIRWHSVVISLILTYLFAGLFFLFLGFNYSVFSDEFDFLKATIQIATYILVFRLVYAQITHVFNTNSKG